MGAVMRGGGPMRPGGEPGRSEAAPSLFHSVPGVQFMGLPDGRWHRELSASEVPVAHSPTRPHETWARKQEPGRRKSRDLTFMTGVVGVAGWRHSELVRK